jgi:hypothetical protein
LRTALGVQTTFARTYDETDTSWEGPIDSLSDDRRDIETRRGRPPDTLPTIGGWALTPR